jgi:DNA transformation protein and related proteins
MPAIFRLKSIFNHRHQTCPGGGLEYLPGMADDSFKEFVLDQLSALPDVRARAMFGAHGLYQAENFFGILDEGRLFFKTDAATEKEYTARGMEPFTYESRGKTLTMGYHEVPPEILEQPPELVIWARRAIAVAAAAKKKKAVRRRP